MGLSHHAENHIYDHTVQRPSVETTNMSTRNNFVNKDKALKTAVWGGCLSRIRFTTEPSTESAV